MIFQILPILESFDTYTIYLKISIYADDGYKDHARLTSEAPVSVFKTFIKFHLIPLWTGTFENAAHYFALRVTNKLGEESDKRVK